MRNSGHPLLGDFFSSRRERGLEDLPVLSVTTNSGLVRRNQLARRTESNLSTGEHLLVRSGDIAYNMMRMWQGASGLAQEDGLVSPAYVVLVPKQNIDSRFAAYWFKSSRIVHLFKSYSHGLTGDRLRLYYADFRNISATPPPLPLQQYAADTIEVWDKAIERIDQLVSQTALEKRGIVQRVLRDEAEHLGSKAWPLRRFGELTRIASGMVDPKVLPYRDLLHVGPENIKSGTGEIGALATCAELELISGKYEFDQDAIIYSKIRPNLNKVCAPRIHGVCSADAYPIWVNEQRLLKEFLLQYMLTPKFVHAATSVSTRTGMPKINREELAAIKIPVPPIAEQRRVSTLLGLCDSELKALREQRLKLVVEKKALIENLCPSRDRAPMAKPNPLVAELQDPG